MVSPLFTAFALIAAGRVEVPPAACHSRFRCRRSAAMSAEGQDDEDADRGPKRRR